MTAFVGRLLTITRQGTGPGPATLTGRMSKTISLNNGEIDITSDDDNGFRTLLEARAVASVDIAIEGVLKDDEVLRELEDGPIQGTYTVDFGALGTLSGTFQFSDVAFDAEHNGYVSYSLTMKSSGAYTYTPDAST